MESTVTKRLKVIILITLGLAIVATGFALADPDDAPAAIFARPEDVPSAVGVAPPSSHAGAAEHARALVRTALLDGNLPGVSVAVGLMSPSYAPSGGSVVWTEGFGWRDVGTRTPVTPATRFNIGTAAAVVRPAAASLELAETGTDAAKDWSPEAIGEEGEDFPPLTLLRHLVWQPLGLMPMEYPLAGDRATFYVPRDVDHPAGGRRLMFMRDLACCADGLAFSSTPADLLRVALASRHTSVDGQLAGGTVMSSLIAIDRGIVVVVTSNVAHANTAALASAIADAFLVPSR